MDIEYFPQVDTMVVQGRVFVCLHTMNTTQNPSIYACTTVVQHCVVAVVVVAVAAVEANVVLQQLLLL
jgi:hypothetical protein